MDLMIQMHKKALQNKSSQKKRMSKRSPNKDKFTPRLHRAGRVGGRDLLQIFTWLCSHRRRGGGDFISHPQPKKSFETTLFSVLPAAFPLCPNNCCCCLGLCFLIAEQTKMMPQGLSHNQQLPIISSSKMKQTVNKNPREQKQHDRGKHSFLKKSSMSTKIFLIEFQNNLVVTIDCSRRQCNKKCNPKRTN